jgi:outer membrane biosynthesis protein TonB
MKAIVLLAGMAISGAVAFAGNGETLIDKLVKRRVSYPEALKAKGIEATVNVKLRLIENGEVEILSIDSESEELKASVERQLKSLKFRNASSFIGEEFNYTFRFQVEK